MECQQYHELISAYIDNETSRQETDKLLEHLRECSGCKEVLEFYSNLRTLVKQGSFYSLEPSVAPDFSQRIIERLEAQDKPVSLPKKDYLGGVRVRLGELFRPRPLLAGSLATLLILLSLGTFYYFNQKSSPIAKDYESIDIYLYQHAFRASENTIGDLSTVSYYPEER